MRSFAFAFAATIAFAACGGDSTTKTGVDAPVTTQHDAPVTPNPDAPAAVMGLGAKCGTGMPACPTSAPQCLSTSATAPGFCSLKCHAAATAMTDANGNFGAPNTTPADTAKCTAIYSATPGTADCNVPVNLVPTPTNPIQKSTTFTFDAYCGIDCGTGNTCPSGFTCNTAAMACEPS